MAVAYVTSGFWDATLDAGGSAVSNAFDSGSHTNGFLHAFGGWVDAAAHDNLDDCTYNAVSLTAYSTTLDQANCKQRGFWQVNPPSGSNTLTFDPDAGVGTAAASFGALVYEGVDQATPFSGYTSAVGNNASAPLASQVTITGTAAAGDLFLTWHAAEFVATATAAAPTNYTERFENHSGTVSTAAGDAASAASVTATTTWTIGFGGADWIAEGCNLIAASAGGGGGGFRSRIAGGFVVN